MTPIRANTSARDVRRPAERPASRPETSKELILRGAWIETSVPGAIDVTMECLPDSTLPGDLRKLGYEVTEMDEGERILPTVIVDDSSCAPMVSLSR
jgi:hypothetical protein